MSSNATRPLGIPESRENKVWKTRRSFSLFIWNYQKKINSDLENLISFSVIYRFIGLRHETTEICSINWKHSSNWTVTLNTLLLARWKGNWQHKQRLVEIEELSQEARSKNTDGRVRWIPVFLLHNKNTSSLSNYKHRTSTEFCKLSTAPKLSVIIFENSSKRGTPTNATERWTKRTYMYKHAPTKTIKLVVVNSILNVPCIWSKGYSWCIQLLLACPLKHPLSLTVE